ncbi:MAG: chemotaxis protein CheW [Pseudomonadota bacterium]
MRDRPDSKLGSSHSSVNDCWNKIGVYGDASCKELKQNTHCRNCPIYSAAAVSLLDRDLPAGYLSEWSDHFAQSRVTKELDTHSVFIFRIGGEWLAFPTLALDEVTELRSIHSLPHQRSGITLGLANMRGELLICVSLGKMLGLEKPDSPKREQGGAVHKHLMVIGHGGHRVVFPIDEAHGIRRYHSRELKAVPATIAKAAASYTKAMLPWRNRAVGCLDDELVLHTLNRSVA